MRHSRVAQSSCAAELSRELKQLGRPAGSTYKFTADVTSAGVRALCDMHRGCALLAPCFPD